MLYKRIDQGGHDSPAWTNFVYQITLTYNNNMVHSSIKMAQYEATTSSNSTDVKSDIRLQSSFTTKYPEPPIGSNV